MRRIVSVWLPSLPIDRLRRVSPNLVPGNRPLALIARESRGERISAVNGRARRDGVRPGMALADARAMLPALLTHPAEPRRDAALLARLARWAGRYGPARHVDGIDGLWIDTTGVAHLYATVSGKTDDDASAERALTTHLADRLVAAGLAARIGLAGTLGAAHALARFGRTPVCVVPAWETRAALAPLPVEALRIAPEAVVLLRRLGLGRIGDLYPLPRAALARRFRDKGLAAGVLDRLDQALGILLEPRRPLAEPPALSARRSFAEPLITSAAIEAEVQRLAVELAGQLAATDHGARRLVLSLYRTDATLAAIDAGTSRACRDPRHICDLLTVKLAGIDAGFGIDALALDAIVVEPMRAAQAGLGAAPDDAGRGAGILIDRLASRLGAHRVQRLEPRDSHIPERAAAAVPALLAETPHAAPSAASSISFRSLRPPFLLPRPEPIGVVAEVPEGAPLRFTWRRRMHRIVKAEGPERIAPQWWRTLAPDPAAVVHAPFAHTGRVRDYYRLEDMDGGRYWVFRAGRYDGEEEPEATEACPPAWYLHGVFP